MESQQAGFRQLRSTKDNNNYLSQVTEDTFQVQKFILTTWIAVKQAFDEVWADGLNVKLMRNGVHGALLRWMNSSLHNKRAWPRFHKKT